MNLTRTTSVFLLVVASASAYSTVSSRNVKSSVFSVTHSPLFPKPTRRVIAENTRLFSNPEDAQIVQKEDIGNIGLLQRIENFGQRLKPMALAAKKKSVATKDDTYKSILYTSQSCALFALFIFYRGYRGFFVIIPEVFRQTYAKMKIAVEDPFEDEVVSVADDGTTFVKKKQPLRTTITVSVLAGLVTLSYIISGLLKVAQMFVLSLWGTSSMETSFEAAADEMIETENKVSRITKKKGINGESLNDYAP